jgi:thiol-disulfide isomerase/thioredoxin
VPLRRRSLLIAALPPGVAGHAAAQAQRRPWPKGRATPPLELPTLDGTPWRLADARGRVVALNFWASWCAPCRIEMPSLELMAERHAADGLVVVAVNHKESGATIRRFVGETALDLPVLRDADGFVAKAWEARIFPTTVLVGRTGRIAFSVVGETDWATLPVRQWVVDLLKA